MTSSQSINSAMQHHQAGRLYEAAKICHQVLANDENNSEVLQLLGVIAFRSDNYLQALELIGRALRVNPNSVEAHFYRGQAFYALGKFDDAKTSYQAAISLNPSYAEAYNNLGVTLAALGRVEDASMSFVKAINYKPDFIDAKINLGNAYQDLGRSRDAIECFQGLISTDPDCGLAYVMVGRALQLSGRDAEALSKYQEGLAIDSSLAEGHILLGHMLHDQGMIEDALECFDNAVRLQPENVGARWALVMSQLALVHDAPDSAQNSRGSFSDALTRLDEWLGVDRVQAGANAVGMQQPFYLAYHEVNNKELLSRYGDLCSRLTGSWQEDQGFALPLPAEDNRARIGIVSGQIRNHSVWNAIVKGWLKYVDPEKFAFFIFHTSTAQDAETGYAQTRAAYFAQAPKSMREWVDTIVAQKIDVLIYPEVGMDPPTLKLASMRLAPVQIVAWGHPETSGLPTIDYFLSAEDFEPSNAQDNYREKLIALPHLGCCYGPLSTPDAKIDLDELGIDSRHPIMICAGVPFKYGPQHDWVLIEIAKRVKQCQLVFFHHRRENLSTRLEERLERAFEDAGLFFPSYGIFLPWMKRESFYALMRKADVYLDTIGFSGFNTAMQAIECGLPIVAREGKFMRGRLASGILKRMEVRELVTYSEGEYIDLAVRLGSDKAYNQHLRRRIESNRSVLFNDLVPIRAFEQFVVNVSKRPFTCQSST